MTIVFLGTPEVAVPSLEALVHAGHRVALVVTRPDRPVGRSGRPSAPPVKRAAVRTGLEVHQPTKVRNAAFRQRLADCRPDALVVVGYGRILPLPVLEVAPHGAVNVHFSLLPAYRGAAPVQWALARGETTTGVTTMRLNERMDEGDLLLRRDVGIRDGEHAPELAARLAEVGAALLVETLGGLADGSVERRPQPSKGVSLAPMLAPEDGRVDPSRAASEIEGRVRGFDPWPGVWLARGSRRIRLLEVRALPAEAGQAEPGTVSTGPGGAVFMACGRGTKLEILRVQREGRRAMTARDALNGRQIQSGDRLACIE